MRILVVALLVMVIALPVHADTSCDPGKVRTICCPAACASATRDQDAVLKGCMTGLKCSSTDVANSTRFNRCECPK